MRFSADTRLTIIDNPFLILRFDSRSSHNTAQAGIGLDRRLKQGKLLLAINEATKDSESLLLD